MTTPTQPTPAPPSTAQDARNRAMRHFIVGLLASMAVAALPIVQASLGDIQWSAAWWQALGYAAAAPAIGAAITYIGRYTHPPQP